MKVWDKEDWEKTPYVLYEEIIFLWDELYYDGSLQGVCLYKNEIYYFVFVDEVEHNLSYINKIAKKDCKSSRCFALLKLEEEELKELCYWKKLWDIYGGASRSKKEHEYYHQQKKLKEKELVIKKENIVGWYVD